MKKTTRIAPFRKGQDAKQSAISKLLINFFKNGSLVTTQTKGKYIKGEIDRLTYKSKLRTEASKNVLLKYLRNKKMVDYMFDSVGPLFEDRASGFVGIKKIHIQKGDNAPMVRLFWVKDVPAHGQKKVIVSSQKSKATSKTAKATEVKTKPDTKKVMRESADVKKLENTQVSAVKRVKERVVSK